MVLTVTIGSSAVACSLMTPEASGAQPCRFFGWRYDSWENLVQVSQDTYFTMPETVIVCAAWINEGAGSRSPEISIPTKRDCKRIRLASRSSVGKWGIVSSSTLSMRRRISAAAKVVAS